MNQKEYWAECLAQSMEENGVTATTEQISAIAADIETSHENYGMAFYQPENPMIRELEETKQQLKDEQAKEACPTCHGQGRLTSNGPSYSSNTDCWNCRGAGKIDPRKLRRAA